MDEIGTSQPKAARKHLVAPRTVTRSTSENSDLTRSHGQGNGVRVHGIYFAAVSLIALVLVIIGVAVASLMM